MIRYFLGRELSDRLGVPLARWKRWAREFLPPDPLGGLQSGYARHYSIDQAFTVFLAGHLVSRSRFSIPEARALLSDLDHWLTGEGYRTGTTAKDSSGNGDIPPLIEHLILIDRHPAASGTSSGFGITIHAVLSRRQLPGQDRSLEEQTHRIVALGSDIDRQVPPQALEQTMIWITRVLRHFTERLAIKADLFAALRYGSEGP